MKHRDPLCENILMTEMADSCENFLSANIFVSLKVSRKYVYDRSKSALNFIKIGFSAKIWNISEKTKRGRDDFREDFRLNENFGISQNCAFSRKWKKSFWASTLLRGISAFRSSSFRQRKKKVLWSKFWNVLLKFACHFAVILNFHIQFC